MLDKLNIEEALQAKFEDTDRMLEQYRLDDHELMKTKHKKGRRMSQADLIYYVTKENPRIWVERSNYDENVLGFYSELNGHKTHIVAFDKGSLPEWSGALVDNADLAYKEVRGWKTILLRLRAANVVSDKFLDKMDREHGTPGDHKLNDRWNQLKNKLRG